MCVRHLLRGENPRVCVGTVKALHAVFTVCFREDLEAVRGVDGEV